MSQPKIAVFGAGRWGKNHVRNFFELGALAAVVDPFEGAQAVVDELAPGTPFYTDPAAVFADSDIQGVVLATPAFNHAADTRAAVEAGKHVFVEKPMAMSVADAEAMQKVATENDKILMIGHLLLYQPAITWIRDAIAQGTIGKVLHVETRRLNLGTVRNQENVFWSFSPHDLAVIHVLLGEPALQKVQAFGQCAIQPEIEDQVHVDYTFEGGCTAHVHAAWFWPDRLRCTTVIGDKGMIVYDEIAQTLTHYDRSVNPETLELHKGPANLIDIADDQPLRLECQHFLDCIKENRRPLSHGAHGVEVIRMLEDASKTLAH